MQLMNIKNQDQIMRNWSKLLDAEKDIQNDDIRLSDSFFVGGKKPMPLQTIPEKPVKIMNDMDYLP